MGSYSRNGAGALALQGVTKRYGTREAVSAVSFELAHGESVALVGPSGAGKTTLLRLVAGTLAPDGGSLYLGGENIAGMMPGREMAKRVGIVAQQFDLVPNLSALNNVLAGRLGQWGFWKSLISLLVPRDKRLGLEALDRVGIAELAYERAARLSGGEQQRVAIARVLVQDPALILADEPVSSLDPARSHDVLRLLIDIARDKDKTLLASMHAVDLAKRYFARLIGVRNGQIEFDLPASQVTDSILDDLYAIERMPSAASA